MNNLRSHPLSGLLPETGICPEIHKQDLMYMSSFAQVVFAAKQGLVLQGAENIKKTELPTFERRYFF